MANSSKAAMMQLVGDTSDSAATQERWQLTPSPFRLPGSIQTGGQCSQSAGNTGPRLQHRNLVTVTPASSKDLATFTRGLRILLPLPRKIEAGVAKKSKVMHAGAPTQVNKNCNPHRRTTKSSRCRVLPQRIGMTFLF